MTKPIIPDRSPAELDTFGVKVEWNPGARTWDVLFPGFGWVSHRTEAVARHRARCLREMLRTSPPDVEPEPEGLAPSDAFAAVGITVEWDQGSSMWCVRRPNEGWGYYCGHAEAWHKAAELYREIRARADHDSVEAVKARLDTLRRAAEEADEVGRRIIEDRQARRRSEVHAAIAVDARAIEEFEAAHPVPEAVRPTPLPKTGGPSAEFVRAAVEAEKEHENVDWSIGRHHNGEVRVEQTGDLWAVLIPGRSLPALFYNPKMANQYAADIGRGLAEANGRGADRG